MASSTTSFDGDASVGIRQPIPQRTSNRYRQQRNRVKVEQQRVISYSGGTATLMDSSVGCGNESTKLISKIATKSNRRNVRNLREKRRPTGIFHTVSTESQSTEESDNGDDDSSDATKNEHAHAIRLIIERHASQDQDNGDDENDDGGNENDDDDDGDGGENLRSVNEKLKAELREKECYIKKLESMVQQLQLQLQSHQ